MAGDQGLITGKQAKAAREMLGWSRDLGSPPGRL
jgi:hypothetical protein